MFIATSARPKGSLRQERNPAAESLSRQAEAVALLRSFGEKKRSRQAINISLLWNENVALLTQSTI